MNKRYKGKMDIEIDGFMLLLIGVFVILPLGRCLVRKLPGGSEAPISVKAEVETSVETSVGTSVETVAEESVPVISSGEIGRFKLIDLSSGERVVDINKGVKFIVEDNVVKITSKSPSGKEGKLEFKKYLRNRCASVVFDEEGTWELTFLDKDGFSLNWYKINVY